jgi:hypothetical protein
MMITPPEIDDLVIKFAESIVANPEIMRIRLVDGLQSKSCGANVRDAIKQCGGQSIKGWRVWLLPHVMLQAEAHAVWQAPNGVIADVTPTGDGDQESVFFSDPTMEASPGDDFIHSPRKNICGLPLVDEYIQVARVANEWTDKQNHGNIILPNIAEQARVQELNKKINALSASLQTETKS